MPEQPDDEALTHAPCCSAHGRNLTCSQYRRSHFVEVRPCCAADALVYEGEEAERAKRLAELDLTPLPAEEVWSSAEVSEGVPLVFLGEDGEECITPGHRISDEDYARALAAYTGNDPEVFIGFEAVWLVARRHAEDCREDLEPDEDCTCGYDWAWWGSIVSGDEPGAIAVTRWSA